MLHALFHRDRTGQGQLVTTSIVYAHLLNNSTHWADAEGRLGADQPHLDALALGVSALERLLLLRKGVDLPCRRATLAGADRRRRSPGPGHGSPLHHTARRTQGPRGWSWRQFSNPSSPPRTATEWDEALTGAGIPAEISSETFSLELFDDPELSSRGWTSRVDQALVGTFEAPGDLRPLSPASTGSNRLPPLVVGSHTREILASLGYDGPTVDDLIRVGVATEP